MGQCKNCGVTIYIRSEMILFCNQTCFERYLVKIGAQNQLIYIPEGI
jgi:hypothetical protein